MTTTDDQLAATNPTRTGVAEAEAALELRTRALAEAQAAIRHHVERAKELRESAISTARQLLGADPSASTLLSKIEAGLTNNASAELDAFVAGLGSQEPDPIKAMDDLLTRRTLTLDEAMRRIMQRGQTPPNPPEAEPRAEGA